jgi:amidohydrolase
MVSPAAKELVRLRRDLHQHPELSGEEEATALRIKEFLQPYAPDRLIEKIGGHGLAAIYDSGAGPCILLRCELDALPIEEENTFAHRSRFSGRAHKCGHDGHMTILAGLAPWLHGRPFRKGRVVLLFQPAEENGQGARAVLEDAKFQAIQADYVFALHNIPGYPLHQIIQLEQQFSATVISVAIRLRGLQSHAAEPEHGRNPAWAMAEITRRLQDWIVADPTAAGFTLITPVYTRMGQPDYGISAGSGELHFTLRCWESERMDQLVRNLEELVARVGQEHALSTELEYFDYFPAGPNDETANRYLSAAARAAGLPLVSKKVPFKFGEDFGWLAQKWKGAMFGLGAGTDTPALHNPHYDFPEALISSGIGIFQAIIREVLQR